MDDGTLKAEVPVEKTNTQLTTTTTQKASKAPAQALSQTSVEAKVKELAANLKIPLSKELLSLGNNDKISSAIIDKAIELGRSEAEINAAMNKM